MIKAHLDYIVRGDGGPIERRDREIGYIETRDNGDVIHGALCIAHGEHGERAILHAVNCHDELVARLEVACDWLADKGVPAEHVEMVRIRAAIARAKGES